MKFFRTATDGGADSHVTGFFFCEIKPLFSAVLLHFRNGTREAFHSHAFNAITWVLRGKFEEHRITDVNAPGVTQVKTFVPSFKPKVTLRDNTHKVFSIGDTWALSLRGPWVDKWKEYKGGKFVTLTHGRKVVDTK